MEKVRKNGSLTSVGSNTRMWSFSDFIKKKKSWKSQIDVVYQQYTHVHISTSSSRSCHHLRKANISRVNMKNWKFPPRSQNLKLNDFGKVTLSADTESKMKKIVLCTILWFEAKHGGQKTIHDLKNH